VQLHFAIQGIRPRRISSILGWVVAVVAIVFPSQRKPEVIQRISNIVSIPRNNVLEPSSNQYSEGRGAAQFNGTPVGEGRNCRLAVKVDV
jgi:hypothetical protein